MSDSPWLRLDPPLPEEDPEDPQRPSAWRVVRRAAGYTYDYLGTTLAASFLWFLTSLGAVILLSPLVTGFGRLHLEALAALVSPVLCLLSAGVFRLASRMVARDDPGLPDLLRGLRRQGLVFVGLGLVNLFLAAVLMANLAFYLTRSSPAVKLIAIPFGYLQGFLIVTWLYQPALVLRQGVGLKLALKRSALLVMDNLGFTSGLALFSLVFSGVCLAAVVPMALLWPVLMAVLSLVATDTLLRKYEAVEEGKGERPDRG